MMIKNQGDYEFRNVCTELLCDLGRFEITYSGKLIESFVILEHNILSLFKVVTMALT